MFTLSVFPSFRSFIVSPIQRTVFQAFSNALMTFVYIFRALSENSSRSLCPRETYSQQTIDEKIGRDFTGKCIRYLGNTCFCACHLRLVPCYRLTHRIRAVKGWCDKHFNFIMRLNCFCNCFGCFNGFFQPS